MHKDGFGKTVEEIFRERADVLYRTSKALSDALKEIGSIKKLSTVTYNVSTPSPIMKARILLKTCI